MIYSGDNQNHFHQVLITNYNRKVMIMVFNFNSRQLIRRLREELKE